MRSENLVNAVMEEVNRLGLADHPDIPVFKKSMERLATEMYELIDEGEFRKACTVVSKLETTVVAFVNSLWFHNHISITVATELKHKFFTFANAKRNDLWNRACRKDEEEFGTSEQKRHEFEDAAYQRSTEEAPIDYDEFERHIDEKLQEVYRECDEMRKSMNPFSKPSTIIIIMK